MGAGGCLRGGGFFFGGQNSHQVLLLFFGGCLDFQQQLLYQTRKNIKNCSILGPNAARGFPPMIPDDPGTRHKKINLRPSGLPYYFQGSEGVRERGVYFGELPRTYLCLWLLSLHLSAMLCLPAGCVPGSCRGFLALGVGCPEIKR